MPWLYLVLSAVAALLTWNVFRPIRAGRLKLPSFAAGFLAGELAPLHIVLGVLGTAFFAWDGALEAWPGRLGLVLSLGAIGGLAFAAMEAHGARLALRRALRTALGPSGEDAILPQWRARLSDAIDWRRALLPLPIRPGEVERIRDIHFARARGVDLSLDVYRHRSRPIGCPTLLQVHGGGWSFGSKNDQALPLLHHLAARGWVCVSADYRLSPHATLPEHLVDLKRAIQWIRTNGPAYGADPDFLVVTGGSAGAHLCALLALTPNDPEYQPDFEDADTRVSACVPLYGVYDLADRHGVWRDDDIPRHLETSVMKAARHEAPREYEKASPIARIGIDAPPFLVVHGDRDSMAPVEGARHFVEAYRARAKAPIAYAELRGAQHGFDGLPSIRAQHAVRAVERFLACLYGEYRSTRLDALDDIDGLDSSSGR